PDWLTFDTATQTFNGTPDNNDVDVIDVKVTATDIGGLSVSDDFTLTINHVNDAPVLGNNSLNVGEGQTVVLSVSDLSASDVDNDNTTLTFTISNILNGQFELVSAAGVMITGFTQQQILDGNVQFVHSRSETAPSYDVNVSDGALSDSGSATITFNEVNVIPELFAPIMDQVTNEDAAFSFTVPTDTFTDPDAGDNLTLSAKLANGNELPGWLSFDAGSGVFNGTPDNDDVDVIDVKVTATDTGGLSVSDDFTLTINNVNDAPIVSNAIVDQVTDEDLVFSFTVPTDTFSDDDTIHGDALNYNATLSDDSALPSWLSFNASTQTFSGTAPESTIGEQINIQVTATDLSGLRVSDTFELNVTEQLVNIIDGDDRRNHLDGTDGSDLISGFEGDDDLHGKGGDDVIYGGAGKDKLKGDKGDDQLFGGDGDDKLDDKHGNNLLYGGAGKDKLKGGDGDDQLFGGTGKDKLEGKRGMDLLDGGEGDDDIKGGDGNDQLFGGLGKDKLKGDKGDDQLFGGDGDDKLEDKDGNNILDGGAGDDKLKAGDGTDYLSGGTGNDKLEGGKGDDTYFFSRGDDIDEIKEKGGDDVLRFGEGIVADDLWFWKDKNDLNIGINGTEDRIEIDDWYKKDSSRVEVFELSDGQMLLDNQVQQLVDAMAVFDVPKSGSLDVPQEIQDNTQAVITTAWQPAA
ncbi:MAG: hypothetical protein DRQ48_12190, partial [Gammaproteobacteria bacterium]